MFQLLNTIGVGVESFLSAVLPRIWSRIKMILAIPDVVRVRIGMSDTEHAEWKRRIRQAFEGSPLVDELIRSMDIDVPTAKKEEVSLYFHGDPFLIWSLWILSFVCWFYLAPEFYAVIGFVPAAFPLVYYVLTSFVPPDEAAVVNFLFSRWFIRDGRALVLSKRVKIPGTRETVYVPDPEKGIPALNAPIRHSFASPRDAVRHEIEVEIVLNIDLDRAGTATLFYYNNFSMNNRKDALSNIDRDIGAFLRGMADEIFFHLTAEVLHGRYREACNLYFHYKLLPMFAWQLGLNVITAKISDVKGPFIDEIERASEARAKADADKAVAQADMEARTVQAERNRDAAISEQKAARLSLAEEENTLEQRVRNERVIARQALQKLEAFMVTSQGKEHMAFIEEFRQMTPEQQIALVRAMGESFGLKNEGTLVGLGDLVKMMPFNAFVEAMKNAMEAYAAQHR